MNQNNFNNNDPLLQSPFQNPVTEINDILNYVNNLQDLGFKNQDHELMLNPPYQLTLSLDSLLLPARRNRKNKINRIPRPQNAWVLFRKDYEANKRNQFPDQLFKMKTVSINAGNEWKIQSPQVKRYFEILSKLALAKHKIMFPDYKYTPKRKSSNNNEWVFHKTFVPDEDNQINKINEGNNSYEFSTSTTSPIASQNTFIEFNNEFSEVDTSHQPEHYNDHNVHLFMQFTPYASSPFQNPVTEINDILNYVNNLQDLGFKNQDHELMLNPPYQLTLSLDSLLLPARRNRKNKINRIPRPQNAWVLFRKDYEANKRNQFPDQLFKMKTVSINAGNEWKIQSPQVKRYFEILSKLALAKHKIMFPDYKYTPKRKSSNNNEWVFHKTFVPDEDNQINKINEGNNSYEFSTSTTSPIASQNTFIEFNNEFSEVDTSHQPEHYNDHNVHLFMQFTPYASVDIHDNSNDKNNNYINDIHEKNNNNNDIHDSNKNIDNYINDNNINENINHINYNNIYINDNTNYNIEAPFVNTFIYESPFAEFNNIEFGFGMNPYNETAPSMMSMNSLNYPESMTGTPLLTDGDDISEYVEYVYSDDNSDTVDAATECFPNFQPN
ncbi:hypothetical protein Glove_395g33 [Diversispora epigaea]|uniref:HMG box domain-containing protein n=1 Tax=Diversispora epigaea TaxID=1348612 RepID=A0A397H5P9_9GLOM|nr:hypothetical protein Glove_395g33 [Diversispora epigaea]